MSIAKTPEDLIKTKASPQTIGPGASYDSPVSYDCSALTDILVGMRIAFGATPDGNALLEVFTSPDDVDFDTEPFFSFTITL